MILLEIADYNDGKILYVTEEIEKITAYYFDNNEECNNDEIRDEIESILDDLDESANIGRITVQGGDDRTWLDHVEVNGEHRGKGIGKTLIRLAIRDLNLTHIACVKESESYKFSLTLDGEMLIASCIRNNIVTENMCVFSGGTQDILEDDLEEGDLDPGYDSGIVRTALGRVDTPSNSQDSSIHSSIIPEEADNYDVTAMPDELSAAFMNPISVNESQDDQEANTSINHLQQMLDFLSRSPHPARAKQHADKGVEDTDLKEDNDRGHSPRR